jgi:uncharacterized protein YkwD
MNAISFRQAALGGAFLVLSCTFLAALPMHTAPAQAPLPVVQWPARIPSVEEQFFFKEVNRERAAQGLPECKWDETLALAARKHAALMASRNELSHQLAGELPLDKRAAEAGARFSRAGENVAIGPETPGIHDAWMHSPGHRANILGAGFTALGVGVVEQSGQLYAVEDFSTAVENLSPEQQEAKLAALLASRGFRVLPDRTGARGACLPSYLPPRRQAVQIFRLDLVDLNTVSEELDQRLREAKYRQAEVGACAPAASADSFAHFRMTILLTPE